MKTSFTNSLIIGIHKPGRIIIPRPGIIRHLLAFALLIAAYAGYAQTQQVFTTSGTYTVPAGVTQLTVECWGGGGAGGGATGNPAAGGGGAGGCYVKKIVSVTPGTTYTVTVGGVKTGNTSNSAAQNKGNPSWFGSAATVYAPGGDGGEPALSNNVNGAGGVGNTTGAIGDVMYAGGNGAAGNRTSGAAGGAGGGGAGSAGDGGNASAGTGGTGTANNGGDGYDGPGNSSAGSEGIDYGGGGSGGKANSSTDRAGGNGAPGLVIVTIPPANDFCFDATQLLINNGATTGTIAGASGNLAPCTGSVAYDVWYSFTTTCAGNHTITVDGASSFDAVFQLFNGCNGSAINSSSNSVGNTTNCIDGDGNGDAEYATYNLAANTTYYVRVYEFNSSGEAYPSTPTFTIEVTSNLLPTTSNAGPDQTGASTCGLTSVTLAANAPSSGTGSWSIVSGTGGSFANASVRNTTFSGVAGNTYVLRWSIATACATSTDDVEITFNRNETTANAGTDQNSAATCNITSVTLNGNNPTSGTGMWSIVSGTGGSFANAAVRNTTFTGDPDGAYTLRWTITAPDAVCGSSSDDVVIAFHAPPVANAGPDQTGASTCGLTTVTLAASQNAGTGVWSKTSGSGGSFSNTSNPNATFTGTAGQTYVLRWTVTNSPCAGSSFDEVTIRFNVNPVLNITNPAAVCSPGTVNLTAAAVTNGSTGSGTLSYWTNAAATNALVSPAAVGTSGTYYIKSTTTAGCVDINPVIATITTPPVATFSYTQSPVCKNGANPAPTFSGGGIAGTFSSTAGLAFVSTSTGQVNLSTSTAGTYTVTNTIAAAGGCSAVQATSSITITPVPSATISYTGGPFCKSLTSKTVTRTGTAGGTYSAPAGLSINTSTGEINPSASTAGTYTVTYTVAAAGGCAQYSTTTSVTIVALPTPTITADYCNPGGGLVRLTSSAASSYSWSTGETTQQITVDIAGTYTVNVTNANGCVGTAFVNVAQELVTNGDFSAGNTGFTSYYTNQQSFYITNNAGSGLYPEGLYAVNSNANSYHPVFFGTDHTTGTGNFMMINGSGAPVPPEVWQQTINIQPNTTYYFSAWAMSLNAVAPYAKLRFAVNDVQVGTIAILNAGATSTSGPFNWVRFYGTWTSGPSDTQADLSILDIETALGGNDFGLDDISFGTLSPTQFAVAPGAGIAGNSVCEGSSLTLYTNREGGMSPFTYSWTGPGGFTSTAEDPFVSSSTTTARAGTYNLTVTDAQGCSSSGSFTLAVNTLPTNVTPTVTSSLCSGNSTNVQITSSQTGVSYQLRNNADNSLIGTAVSGTGGTINLPTGILNTTTTFNVLATNTTSGCSRTLSATPTVTVNTSPVLVITNQAVCSGTVNLTAAGVTAGSTGGGTLSYWTNAAATTALANPSAVAASGTYYIKSTLGSCSDIEAVVVSITSTPVATFNYSTTTFCSTGSDPSPTYSGGGVAGVFSSPTGAVFVSTSTGQIDLSATPAGTHTITNTITPSGACSPVSVSRTITVTAMPSAEFSYGSTVLCQNANAADPSPIFGVGASAGTFSSSFGLSFISTSTGQIDLSACTPGNYAITNTKAAAGGCSATSYTAYILINPYTFSGGVVSTTSASTICSGQTIDLASAAPIYLSAILQEDFNSTTNQWTTTNNSTGGTPANAAFILRAEGYDYGGAFSSNDDSQFYLTNSQAQGSGGTTNTVLKSPAISTVGYTTLALDFFHYFNYLNSGDVAKVQVSVDGFNWIDVATYNSTQGSRTGFVNAVVDISDYVGLSQLYIRFYYTATNDRYWAIDNVSVTGYSSNYSYSWTSSPLVYSSGIQNPTAVMPSQTASYTATATNTYGCSASATPVSTTVNPSPSLSSTLTPNPVCSNTSFTYTPTSATSGSAFTWTRAAVAGISNAAVTTPQSSNPNETLVNTTGAPINVVYTYVTSKSGCSTTQNVTVKVNAPNTWNGGTTNWFTGSNWCINGSGIPTTTTDAIIPSTAITGQNPIIDNAQGTGAVARNIVIATGGGLTINGTAGLGVYGKWNNNGTFTANSSTVTFNGSASDTLTGSGTQTFYNLTLNKGTDTTSVLYAKVPVTVSNTYTSTKGLYQQTLGALTLSSSSATTIASGSGIDIIGTMATAAGISNSGLFRVSGGTATIGTTLLHNFDNTGGTARVRISSGTLNVAGNYTATANSMHRFNGGDINIGGLMATTGSATLYQTAGNIVLNTGLITDNSNALFEIAGGTHFTLSGGSIILQNANLGTGRDMRISNGAGVKVISPNHTLQVGNNNTLASSVFRINTGANTSLGKLHVYNADGLIVRLINSATAMSLQLDRALDLNTHTFVLNNSSPAAITGTGYVTCEDATAKFQWNIGNNSGTYVFPFGNNAGVAIPFTFDITTAGTETTGGNISVNTYPTDDDNFPLPAGVVSMTMEDGGNGSRSSIDRWWVIDANNYSVKPVSNMTFKYASADVNGNQLLEEEHLKAQRFDASINGWNPPDFFGPNIANESNKTVTVQNVTNYSPWTLHDGESNGSSPLPIELLSFNAKCNGDKVTLDWVTVTEVNNDYFTIQRSADMVVFTDIAVVDGAGNSNAPRNYTADDESPVPGKAMYYRLMQTDYNGEFEIFNAVVLTCDDNLSDIITMYPNPATTTLNINMSVNTEGRGSINVYSEMGQLVKTLAVEPYKGVNNYKLDISNLAYGQYYVSFEMGDKRFPVQKLIVIR